MNQNIKEFRSSIVLLITSFLGTMIISFMLIMGVFLILLHLEDENILLYALILAILISLGFEILFCYGIVTVKDDEVCIKRPLRKEQSISRRNYGFSSRVIKHYSNGIPAGTERILIVYNEEKEWKIKLPKISKRAFDEIISLLRKQEVSKEDIPTMNTKVYLINKHQMLEEHKGLIRLLVIVGLIVTTILVAFLANTIMSNSPNGFNLAMLFILVLTTGSIFLVPGIIVFSGYRKKRKIVERIVLEEEYLIVDDTRVAWRDINKITMTPPEYTQTRNMSMRSMIIEGVKGNTKVILGPCMTIGRWKTIFTEYPEFCEQIEQIAAIYTIDFYFDL